MADSDTSDSDIDCISEEEGVVELSTNYEYERKLTSYQLYGPRLVMLLLEAKRTNEDQRVHFFQREAVLRTLAMVEKDRLELPPNEKPILLCLPSGSGKTAIITMLPYVLQANRTLILTPSRILSNQIAESFGHFHNIRSFFEVVDLCKDLAPPEELLEPVTVIEGQLNPEINFNKIFIVNAQKFGGKSGTTLNPKFQNQVTEESIRKMFKNVDLLIVDEAQHYPAATWDFIVTKFFVNRFEGQGKGKTAIFLTATPNRGDGKPILGDDQKDRIAYTLSLAEIEGNTVRKLRFEEKKRDVNAKAVFEDISTLLEEQKLKEPRFEPQAMIIVRTKRETQAWAKKLNTQKGTGNFAVAIIGDKNSQWLTNDFTKGAYKVAVVCNLLKEGYCNPKVTLCVILRNIRSRVLFDQFVGRGMRLNRDIEGVDIDKTEAVVLSYQKYGQGVMWAERPMLAECDPFDENEESVESDSRQGKRLTKTAPTQKVNARPKRKGKDIVPPRSLTPKTKRDSKDRPQTRSSTRRLKPTDSDHSRSHTPERGESADADRDHSRSRTPEIIEIADADRDHSRSRAAEIIEIADADRDHSRSHTPERNGIKIEIVSPEGSLCMVEECSSRSVTPEGRWGAWGLERSRSITPERKRRDKDCLSSRTPTRKRDDRNRSGSRSPNMTRKDGNRPRSIIPKKKRKDKYRPLSRTLDRNVDDRKSSTSPIPGPSGKQKDRNRLDSRSPNTTPKDGNRSRSITPAEKRNDRDRRRSRITIRNPVDMERSGSAIPDKKRDDRKRSGSSRTTKRDNMKRSRSITPEKKRDDRNRLERRSPSPNTTHKDGNRSRSFVPKRKRKDKDRPSSLTPTRNTEDRKRSRKSTNDKIRGNRNRSSSMTPERQRDDRNRLRSRSPKRKRDVKKRSRSITPRKKRGDRNRSGSRSPGRFGYKF